MFALWAVRCNGRFTLLIACLRDTSCLAVFETSQNSGMGLLPFGPPSPRLDRVCRFPPYLGVASSCSDPETGSWHFEEGKSGRRVPPCPRTLVQASFAARTPQRRAANLHITRRSRPRGEACVKHDLACSPRSCRSHTNAASWSCRQTWQPSSTSPSLGRVVRRRC